MWIRTSEQPHAGRTILDRRARRSGRAPRGRSWRPSALELLEGRALLAASAFDPTFGNGGVVVGPLRRVVTGSDAVEAIAVQGDNKVVTAEVDTLGVLLIRRYNADGSLDSTFGTQGETIISLGAPITTPPHNLTITPTGQILVAAASDPTPATSKDVVARLTSTGALDTTFDPSGVVTLPSSITEVNSVVVENSGRVVVAGISPAGPSGSSATTEGALVGLTSTGSLDLSFGTEGEAYIAAATAPPGQPTDDSSRVVALRLTASGQLVLGVDNTLVAHPGVLPLPGPITQASSVTLSRLSASGTIDTTFGTGGTTDSLSTPANDFIVAADGSIILAGSEEVGVFQFAPALFRVTAQGTLDSSFQTNVTTTGIERFVAVVAGPNGSITALSANFMVARFTSTGALDPTFGRGGLINAAVPSIYGATSSTANALAFTNSGKILVGGGYNFTGYNSPSSFLATQSYLAQLLPVRAGQVINDYDGDGRTDLAAELTQFDVFATRASSGAGDTVQPFGTADAIPAPGDYDGDGKADVAAYLPEYGVLAYRPSTGGADVLVRFGPTGVGNAIPAPGDYDGDGKTDVALYLPSVGSFVINPSSGATPYAVAFGSPGAGNTIPVPGDYDGDGRTDVAVYLPAFGTFAIKPSGYSSPYAVSFGSPGAGNTIPAPGDYDGDGKTNLAAYLPQFGVFAYRGRTGDVLTPFGPPGKGNALAVPGDYDGDGRDDIALYLPGSAAYAIDPSSGAAPYAVSFGNAGPGNTIPATAVVETLGATVSTMSLRAAGPADADAGVLVYLPDFGTESTTGRKKSNA